MKLSIVTAVFNAISSGNRERLIRCIESVASVKTPHEHLIYDGASTDGTVTLLGDLEEKGKGRRWNVRIVSEPDDGIYNALNKGVRDASGEWLYVLGCDDYILSPDALGGAIEYAEERRLDVVSSPVAWDDEGDRLYHPNRPRIILGSSYPHQGLLMRTELARRLHGFDERYAIAADYDQELRAFVSGAHIGFYDRAFAYFSSGGVSCSEKNRQRCYEECAEILARALSLTIEQSMALIEKKTLPLGCLLRLTVHPSSEIRYASRHLFFRNLARVIGLTKDDGTLRWHGGKKS